MPKSNGYQSLHTTVVGEEGKPVEIQIRTQEMHRVAEYGIAAHWRYKEGETDRSLDSKMTWIRQMLDWQKELSDAKDFMDSLKVDLFGEEVFVFSPKGAVHDFPQGATPVDFAYRVHTEVGHRCIGAKINGRIVPLDSKLKNGDIVEILTGKVNNPSLDWLNFVQTSAARAKIKGFFKTQRTEDNLERGEKSLENEIRKLQLNPDELLNSKEFDQLVGESGHKSREALFEAIGVGELSPYQTARTLREKRAKTSSVPAIEEEAIRPMLTPESKNRRKGPPVRIAGLEGVLVKMSRCCRPLPGEEIVGFVTKGRGVAIHRQECPNLSEAKAAPEKLVSAKWSSDIDESFPIELEVEAFDRVGVLKDILGQIAEIDTNVSAATIRTKRGSSAILKLVVDVKNIAHLNQVFTAVRKVSDVYEVARSDIFRKGSML